MTSRGLIFNSSISLLCSIYESISNRCYHFIATLLLLLCWLAFILCLCFLHLIQPSWEADNHVHHQPSVYGSHTLLPFLSLYTWLRHFSFLGHIDSGKWGSLSTVEAFPLSSGEPNLGCRVSNNLQSRARPVDSGSLAA